MKRLTHLVTGVRTMSRFPIVDVDEHPVTESILIDGPPGTGKTTQISERIEEFIRQTNSDIHNIQLVTYRVSLANEIIDRLKEDGLVPASFNPKKSNIGTLHAICNRMLRKLGIDVSHKVSWYHKKLFCEQYGIQYTGKSQRDKTAGEALFGIFAWMLSTKSTPQQVPQSKYDELVELAGRRVDLRRLHKAWTDFKQNPPVDEFDDLDQGDELYEFDELLLLVSEQRIIPYNIDLLVVDEMHDVYPAMYDVIQMWMDEMDDTTFIIAGDKHQVITEYQGASPEFYESIDLPEVSLPTTYRCPSEHVRYAHEVLSHQFETPAVEADSDGGTITDVTGPKMYENYHGEWTVSTSKNNPADLYDEYVEGGESAIYAVRINEQAKAIAKSLEDEGIPFISNSVRDFNDSELLDLYNAISKIRSIDDYSDINVDGKFSADELGSIIRSTRSEYINGNKSEIEFLFRNLSGGYEISKIHNILLEKYYSDIIQNNIEDTLLDSVEKDKLTRLIDKHKFKLIEPDGISTKILTIHAAKGLEADNVFLYDGIPGQIHDSITTSTSALRNECRVWYVGATRSSDTLVIVRDAFDMRQSPFLPLVNSEQSEVVQQ